MANMHQLLKAMIEKGASDLHITTGTPPQLRIDGKLHPLKMPPLSPQETKQLCYSVLTDAQKHRFEETNELDLSFSVQKLSRFRGNIFVQRGNVAGAFRAIPFKILTFEELGPAAGRDELSKKSRAGLILVTGPTGSGKSTTLASHRRQDQRGSPRAHRDDRGPHRVPAPPQGLRRESARGGRPIPRASSRRSSTSCARIPTWSSSASCATSRPSKRR